MRIEAKGSRSSLTNGSSIVYCATSFQHEMHHSNLWLPLRSPVRICCILAPLQRLKVNLFIPIEWLANCEKIQINRLAQVAASVELRPLICRLKSLRKQTVSALNSKNVPSFKVPLSLSNFFRGFKTSSEKGVNHR